VVGLFERAHSPLRVTAVTTTTADMTTTGWWGHGHKGCHGKRVSGLDERWLMSHIETNLFEIAGG